MTPDRTHLGSIPGHAGLSEPKSLISNKIRENSKKIIQTWVSLGLHHPLTHKCWWHSWNRKIFSYMGNLNIPETDDRGWSCCSPCTYWRSCIWDSWLDHKVWPFNSCEGWKRFFSIVIWKSIALTNLMKRCKIGYYWWETNVSVMNLFL